MRLCRMGLRDSLPLSQVSEQSREPCAVEDHSGADALDPGHPIETGVEAQDALDPVTLHDG